QTAPAALSRSERNTGAWAGVASASTKTAARRNAPADLPPTFTPSQAERSLTLAVSVRRASNCSRGSVARCLRDGAAPLATWPTTVRPTIHAHRDRLVVELERGVAEAGAQAADAPTAE